MIIFRNEGTIDIRAVQTFGLSSKADQEKIGRFGTGLKYATAVIVRNAGKLSIQSGGETYTIGQRTDEFRGNEITTLTMNDIDLPFTTDLGRDWEPWMAFRELYANALDEGGDVYRSDDPQMACGDETLISVELDAFEAIFFSMEEHFIDRLEQPLWSSSAIDVYKGKSLFVFYKGVAVMKLKEPAAFRYNLKGYLDLTEDRTAKYDFIVERRIADALAASDNEKITKVATDSRNKFEGKLDFCNSEPSEVFIGSSVAHGAACNPTAMGLVRAQLPADTSTATIISKDTPGGQALRYSLDILCDLGADLTKCQFVLAEGIKFHGDYEVKKRAVFLNQNIFDNQSRMILAVVEGYAEVVGNSWLAKRLIGKVDA